MQAGQRVAGAANGSFGLGSCLVQGEGAGLAAAEACGFTPLVVAEPPQADNRDFLPGRWLWRVPGLEQLGHDAKHFVAQQHDVTAADLRLALRESYRSIQHGKRYTTTDLQTEPGKNSGNEG